jgi:hypothetical protein
LLGSKASAGSSSSSSCNSAVVLPVRVGGNAFRCGGSAARPVPAAAAAAVAVVLAQSRTNSSSALAMQSGEVQHMCAAQQLEYMECDCLHAVCMGVSMSALTAQMMAGYAGSREQHLRQPACHYALSTCIPHVVRLPAINSY